MAQAVSHRPLTAEVRVWSPVNPCEVCGRRSGRGYTSISVFPCLYHTTSPPFTSSSRCWYYQKDTRGKLGDNSKSNAPTEIAGN
jgi:hypothetical protein